MEEKGLSKTIFDWGAGSDRESALSSFSILG